jgi:hypothetical protein
MRKTLFLILLNCLILDKNLKMEVPGVQLNELVVNINKVDFVKLKDFLRIIA